METIQPAFQFFTITILATIGGILYWMAVDNLNYLKSRFVLSSALSVVLTPFGAWAVSVFIKAMHLRELHQVSKSA
jgi:hypothetical protein